MRGIIYLAAAVALLRSVAAFLPKSNDHHDIHDELVFEPAMGLDKAVDTPAASRDNIEDGRSASRLGADPPRGQKVKSPGSKHVQSPDDIDLTPHLPPQEPRFTIGSPSSQWAITYTPYTNSLACLSPSTIRADVAAIARKGFTSIRLYSIDCSALHHVGQAALTHGLKMIIGIQLDDGLEDAEIQLSELISWATNNSSDPDPNPATTDSTNNNKWSLIELIVIGNEAIFNTHTDPSTLATFITTSRSTLRSSLYSGPITTTEPLSILTQHSALLCPILDIPASTIHPFFHPSIPAHHAGTYLRSQLVLLSRICPNLMNETSIALETGWPSRGRANGKAVPGYLEQWIAVAGMLEEGVGGRSVFLGWGDEGWRDGGEFGVEGSWGCGHVFGE